MQLKEVIEAVKDRKLSKDQLETYRDSLSELFALMQVELADIRKEKALWWLSYQKESDVATGRAWAVTPHGQREIELSHYSKATEKMLASLKGRLYSIY